MRKDYWAQSVPDGIIFYSDLIPDLCIYAKESRIDGPNKKNKETEESFLERNYELIFSIIAIVSLIAIIVLWNPCDAIRIIASFYGVMHMLPLLDAILSYGTQAKKYHAAEHMVLNAWRKTSSIPKIDDIRKFSRLSKDCGTCFIATKIFFSMLIFLFTSLLGIYVLLFVPVLYTFTQLLRHLHFFNWVEYGVTKTPTNKELEIAIAGLTAIVERETEILDSL